jgi:precorrin-3B C17-methyltransferase
MKPDTSPKGILFLVGIWPGDHRDMTARAIAVLRNCDVVAGYRRYIDLVEPFIAGKEVISSGMSREIERCSRAIAAACRGKKVALISSGDAGVYGMAGLALQLLSKKKLRHKIAVEVVPGVPVINAAAALLGAPLMNDYAVISLSDLLTPWEVIVKRLTHAAQSDMVICIYNPRSTKRTRQIKEAHSLLLQYREKNTVVGIARNVGRQGETVTVTTLGRMLRHKVDMLTVLIIGNSTTTLCAGAMITPRGYKV